MNRTPTLHLKRVTITPHYRPQVLYNIHTLWSLLFSIFSNWAHTKVFSGQSFEPLHLLDLDNLISTLKVLSLLLCNACVNSEFSAFVFIFNLCLILFDDQKAGGKERNRKFICWVFVFFNYFMSRFSLRHLLSSPPEVGSPASSGAVPGLGSMRCIGRSTSTATKPQIDTHNHNHILKPTKINTHNHTSKYLHPQIETQ